MVGDVLKFANSDLTNSSNPSISLTVSSISLKLTFSGFFVEQFQQ